MKIMGAIMGMQLRGESSKYWRCADNVMRELTLEQLIEIGGLIDTRTQDQINSTAVLWSAMVAATTVEQVKAITWTN